MWITEMGGGWPRPGGSAVPGLLIAATAFAFQRTTMSLGSAASDVAAGVIVATAANVTVTRAARHRRREACVVKAMTGLPS